MGGVGSALNLVSLPRALDNVPLPPSLWAGGLQIGYVGCMRDLAINGRPVDLPSYARLQNAGNGVLPIFNQFTPFRSPYQMLGY